MSWLFSQALVEEFLGASCSDGEPSVQSSGNPTQLAYCAPDKMTAFSRLSRYGMTYKPLTADRGEELLTLYLAAFRAKTSAQQDEATAWTENEAECGTTWRGWLAKYDPDSSLWRTPQCSLLEEEPESLQTLPRWGMTVGGLLWELPTLEPITRGTESGLWRTPQAADAKSTKVQKGHQTNLTHQVMKWTTPTAHMAKETNAPSEHKRNTPTLTAQVNWPTPRTKGMCGGSGAWEQLKNKTTLDEARAMGAGNGGNLNPTWVEWLMGWPLGWTDLKPLVMDKSLSARQKHGIS